MEKITKGERAPRRAGINGKRQRLVVKNKLPDFEYRVVNDVEDGQRIQDFLERGWEIDTSNATKVGDKRVDKAVEVKEGSPVKLNVGQGQKAYVMRIRKDWFDEDQQAKQAEIDAMESTLKPEGTYGRLDMESPKARSKFN